MFEATSIGAPGRCNVLEFIEENEPESSPAQIERSSKPLGCSNFSYLEKLDRF
jgi:hypothetical protein